MQEGEALWKFFELIYCCDKLKQIENDIFWNLKVKYIF